MSPTINPL